VKSPSPASDEDSTGRQPSTNKRLTVLLGLVLVVTTLGLFWPVTGYDFVVMDDDHYVYENPGVLQGLSLAGVKWAFTTVHDGYWLPLTWISLMVDHSWNGLFAGGYHMTNIILHTLNTLLLFLLLERMTKALWPSALVAALFAWHPLHLESVVWVTERKDVLSTFFLLLTILTYLYYVKEPVAGRLTLSLVFFVLGLMAKPMLVTLPFVLLLLDFWPLKRLPPSAVASDRTQAQKTCLKVLAEKTPFLIISLAAGVVTIVTQHMAGGVLSLAKVPFSLRVANAIVSYTGYLWKMLCPVNLCAYYPLPPRIPTLTVIASILVLVGVSYLVFRRGRQSPWLITGWLWYLIVLFPVSGLLQAGGVAMADRFTYVALIGIFIMVAWSAGDWLALWPSARPWGFATFSILLGLCVMATRSQLPNWHDGISLFTHIVAVTQENAFAENNLGVALSNAGRGNEAVLHYREALRILPYYEKAHYNLGVELATQGKPAAAAEHFFLLLKYEPGNEQLRNNLGAVLIQEGRLDAAIEQFRQAIKIKPDYAKLYLNYAVALQKLGQNGPAGTNFMMALQLEPDWPEALNQTALFLATCPDAKWRNPAEAIRLSLRANEISHSEIPAFLRTLAKIYACNGNFSNAAFTAELAAQKARASNLKKLTAQITEELKAYQDGRIRQMEVEIPAAYETQH
jgi:tetratricopeptide (TPR) repeat protein